MFQSEAQLVEEVVLVIFDSGIDAMEMRGMKLPQISKPSRSLRQLFDGQKCSEVCGNSPARCLRTETVATEAENDLRDSNRICTAPAKL